MEELISQLASALTIASQLFLVFAILYFIFVKGVNDPFKKFLGKNGLFFAWIVSLVAVFTSLFYSEIMGFEACKLCWLQRIFIYPQTIILGMMYFRRDFQFIFYPLVLAFVGAVISLYHNYLYYDGSSSFLCNTFRLSGSCTKIYILEFGYITIPLMSLTAFLLLIFFLIVQKRHSKNNL